MSEAVERGAEPIAAEERLHRSRAAGCWFRGDALVRTGDRRKPKPSPELSISVPGFSAGR
jgi:hypothetical protein